MQTSVNLQPPFSYSIKYMVFIFIITIILTVIIYIKQKKKVPEKVEIEVNDTKKKNIKAIKIKYLKKLDIVEKKLDRNEITLRRAYQHLSGIIRYFVYTVTGIKVQNCTLEDIKKLKMPMLTELISEYYRPEFAEKSVGDVKASIEKTRKVIKRWN